MKRFLITPLLAVVLLTGCGDDEQTPTITSSTPTPTTNQTVSELLILARPPTPGQQGYIPPPPQVDPIIYQSTLPPQVSPDIQAYYEQQIATYESLYPNASTSDPYEYYQPEQVSFEEEPVWSNDRDGDGVFNNKDFRPDVPDGWDIDYDGQANASDANPYTNDDPDYDNVDNTEDYQDYSADDDFDPTDDYNDAEDNYP